MTNLTKKNIKNKNLPKLRFPAFNEDWLLTTLNNSGLLVVDGDRGTNYPNGNDFLTEGFCLFLNAKNVTKTGFDFGEKSFISKEKDCQLRKGKLVRNDIVLTTRGSIGHVAFYSKNVQFEHLRINSGMVLIRDVKKKFEVSFVYHLFFTPSMINQIKRISFGSAQPQLTVKEINLFKLSIASLPEQKKIADFLTAVDKKIQQLTRKKELLEQYKKGVMQKIFNQEIRFKDKNGKPFPDWQEKRFFDAIEEIIDFRGRTPLKLGMDWGGDILSLSANNVKDGYIDLDAECNMGSIELYKKWMSGVNLQKGDLVFTMEAPLGKALLIPDDKKYILSQRVVAFKMTAEVNNKFLLQLVWSDKFQKRIEQLSTGTTAKGINQKSLKKVNLLLPCLLEQEAIANFLFCLDEKIKIVASVLQKTQEFKKGLLQQMFV